MKALKITLSSAAAMRKLGGAIAKIASPGVVIYLQGELGAGKTTLVRGFLRGCGWPDQVKSPTFSLFEEYQINDVTICHFDLYRLVDPEELVYIGASDYFTSDSICLIEWPERGEGFLQSPDLICKFSFTKKNVGRVVELISMTMEGRRIKTQLEHARLF